MNTPHPAFRTPHSAPHRAGPAISLFSASEFGELLERQDSFLDPRRRRIVHVT